MAEEKKSLVALGVTGCIGAYKAAELLRRLQDTGLEIQPILTESARQFVTPYVLQTLSGRKAITDLWDEPERIDVEHIALSDEIDLLLVAPATANIIAKFANGIADDFLSTFYISTEAPVVIAPAMNTKMLRHPATVRNMEILRERGIRFVEPGTGYLACGWEGKGRLAVIDDIVDTAGYALRGDTYLAGRKVLISAGPTAEPLDPLRFITNRSSGRMGYMLAWEARARGAEVTLVSGPSNLRPPYGVELMTVQTGKEMKSAIRDALDGTEVVIMAAAVTDFRPAEIADSKIKKTGEAFSLTLDQTEDILAWLGGVEPKPFLVGFAAESDNLRDNAKKKLSEKKIDMIVANPIGGEYDVLGGDDTQGLIIGSDGAELEIPRCSKKKMATEILNQIEQRIAK